MTNDENESMADGVRNDAVCEEPQVSEAAPAAPTAMTLYDAWAQDMERKRPEKARQEQLEAGDIGILADEFDPKLFECKDRAHQDAYGTEPERTQVPEALLGNARKLHAALLTLRGLLRGRFPDLEIEIHVISAYRTPKHNAMVRGKKASQHLQCQAADIRVPGLAKQSFVADHVALWQAQGQLPKGGCGWYKTFTHVDVRGVNARWDER
jgi:hypothetical protein